MTVSRPGDGARGHWDAVYDTVSRSSVAHGDRVGAAAAAHFGDLSGRRLLDLGCGTGGYSLFFAARGASVTAVDRSPVAIESLSAARADMPGGNRVMPLVADAFDIAQLGPFDAVFGSMILHHLEPFHRFVRVLHDSLAPGGRAFFYENNGENRGLMWCRQHLAGHLGIPRYGDEVEQPLERSELDCLRSEFGVELEYPELVLFRLAPIYLLRGRGGRACAWIDDRLYGFPRLRRQSYRQYVRLTRRDR